LSKVANFNLPHLHLVPPLHGMTPFEFCRDLQHQKTRVPRLSCGVVCVILRLAVSVEHRPVTDRQTDTHTYTRRLYCASMASRGKMRAMTSLLTALVPCDKERSEFQRRVVSDGRICVHEYLIVRRRLQPQLHASSWEPYQPKTAHLRTSCHS